MSYFILYQINYQIYQNYEEIDISHGIWWTNQCYSWYDVIWSNAYR